MKKLIIVLALLAAVGLSTNAYADSAAAGAAAKSSADNNQTFQAAEQKRMGTTVIPPQMWPNAQYHNAPHTRTWNILPFAELAKVRRIWTREQLESIVTTARGNKGKVVPIPYNAVPAVTDKKDRNRLDHIGIIFSTTLPDGYIERGIIQSKGTTKTNGLRMAADALLKAMNMGGKLFMLTVEEAEIHQYSETLSFMIGGNYQRTAGDVGESGAGAGIGGFGWGNIESWKGLAPFCMAYVLDEVGMPMKFDEKSGDVVPLNRGDQEEYQKIYNSYGLLQNMDEKKVEPEAKGNGNGKKMERYYLETQQQ